MGRVRPSYYAWYANWALGSMAPCDECSPEYREAYGRLQGAVGAAEAGYRAAYNLYVELDRINHRECMAELPDQGDVTIE